MEIVATIGGLTMMYNIFNYYTTKKEKNNAEELKNNVDQIIDEILEEKGETLNTIEDIAVQINKKNLLMELKNKQTDDKKKKYPFNNDFAIEDSDDIIQSDSE